MRKHYRWELEKLESKEEKDVYWFATYRAKVVGGWLMRTFDVTYKTKSTSESMVFIPDSEHQWGIWPPPKAEEPEIPY